MSTSRSRASKASTTSKTSSSKRRPTTARDMSKAELEQYRKAFDLFDLDRDNKISVDELGKVMRALGKNPTKQELADMINNADRHGGQSLEFDDFLAMMIKAVPHDDDRGAHLREAFKIFDKDEDNFISRAELKSAMRKLGENMSDNQIDDVIRQADLDRDGKVNYDEFARILS